MISKQVGVEKCHLANLVTELGFSCEKNIAESNRVCAKCATKIQNIPKLIKFMTGLQACPLYMQMCIFLIFDFAFLTYIIYCDARVGCH